MEHLGSGWQFDAYAVGDRVLKVPITPWVMTARVLRSYPHLAIRPVVLSKKIQGLVSARSGVLQELASREIDAPLIANFREESGRYVQDRVITLEEALRSERLDPRWIMDRYVDSIRAGWKSGMAETSFNFAVNHGLNARGQVVVIDVGEIEFRREAVLQLVRCRFWEGAHSVRNLPDNVRGYLLRRMASALTEEALMRDWKDARPIARRSPAPDRPAARRTPQATPAQVEHSADSL